MLNDKSQDHQTSGAKEEFEDFTIYGHGGHLCRVT